MTIDAAGATVGPASTPEQLGKIKCVVWDLDHTLWDGTLLEGDACAPRAEAVEAIRSLDRLGILHSVASRNDPQEAGRRLAELGLTDYFLYPQISWNAKSTSIQEIARRLNIGLDAVAFVDDQEFELAEVAHALPAVTCVPVAELGAALARPEFRPVFVTAESGQRRELYRSQIRREEVEAEFVGTSEEFLASLGMRMVIRPARREDLQRAEELTVRTNQLNSTGVTYSYEELDERRVSPDHLLLVAELTDRFGSYGTIGLTLVERHPTAWHLRLLLMSCRVMARGVGTVLLNHVMRSAREAGARLRADFVETGRNRMMQITYAFAGFVEVARDGQHVVLESDLGTIQEPAAYLDLVAEPAPDAPEPAGGRAAGPAGVPGD
ncbi:HAD-IIIC family phosphatase [Micromonospora echinospora]|uniref:HAD-IIIC family phosphatase n=1 Tax=Micromonospora echinospora TaxID=1877 RepID=UPI0037B937FB